MLEKARDLARIFLHHDFCIEKFIPKCEGSPLQHTLLEKRHLAAKLVSVKCHSAFQFTNFITCEKNICLILYRLNWVFIIF